MKLPISVLIATKNEEANIEKCVRSVQDWACEVLVVDSHSTDRTGSIATNLGCRVINYHGGIMYPKKRQWALDNLDIKGEWIFLLDADEEVPTSLWDEISLSIRDQDISALFIKKAFHFMGRKFRFGGFSHAALLLFRKGCARFEDLGEYDVSGLDMEVHERLLYSGASATLKCAVKHDDFKGLSAYIDRHNKYSTWEATIRHNLFVKNSYGSDAIIPKFFGNTQERRRYLKLIIIKLPFEPLIWFFYHYIIFFFITSFPF